MMNYITHFFSYRKSRLRLPPISGIRATLLGSSGMLFPWSLPARQSWVPMLNLHRHMRNWVFRGGLAGGGGGRSAYNWVSEKIVEEMWIFGAILSSYSFLVRVLISSY
ncbi:hypothetical protein HDV63DRAFT_8629 [Trichoderma sp. SZMC 28014]